MTLTDLTRFSRSRHLGNWISQKGAFQGQSFWRTLICDWSIYLTASADERLACITQTSFHSTTSFMNPFLATVAQNWIIANFLLTYTTGPLTFLFHLIFHTITEHYLRFSCIHLQTFCFQPWFPFLPAQRSKRCPWYGNVSGWLAGCPSHAGIVSKGLNVSEHFLDHLKARHTSFLWPLRPYTIPRGGIKCTGVEKIIAIFNGYRRLSRKRCEICLWLLWNVNGKPWVPDWMV